MRRKRIYFLWAMGVLTVLMVGGCIKEGSDTSFKSSYFVRKVIDGDTIQLQNGKFVRYIGIDTPETRKRAGGVWHYAPEPYALDAKKLNNELVERGRVELEFDEEKYDKYGRWLAYVYSGKKMVNEEILKAGYAKILMIPPNTKYFHRLKMAETEAKENKRGIWRN